MIDWGILVAFTIIQAILLYINSFFDAQKDIFEILGVLFIFYVVLSLLVNVKSINKILTNDSSIGFFIVFIIYGIYKAYVLSGGFISGIILIVFVLFFGLTVMMIVNPSSENTKTRKNKNLYWKNRLDKYEKAL